MENRIPDKTLVKGLKLIQRTGVDKQSIFEVSRYFDPTIVEKFLQAYIQRGKIEDLDLRGNLNIQEIPKGLKVKKLTLTGNQTLKELPKMEAERILAEDTNIETIGEGLKCEYLNLRRNKVLKHLPKVEAEIIVVMDTNIQTIGDGLKCKELNLNGNKMLKEFPKNLEVKTLVLSKTYFSETHTEEKVRKKIEDEGGTVEKIWI